MSAAVKKRRGRRKIGGVVPAPRLDRRARGGRLTAAERHALPAKDFALPGERYPVDTPNRARNALSRVSQVGSSEEKAAVRRKVHSKYPTIGEK